MQNYILNETKLMEQSVEVDQITNIFKTIDAINYQKVTKGRINDTYIATINGTNEKVFIKININNPDVLVSEIRSLNYLNEQGFTTPRIKMTGSNYIVFQYIDSEKKNTEMLYQELKKLRSVRHQKFGFDHDTYSGNLRVTNKWSDSWSHFFANNRWKILFDDIVSKNTDLREYWVFAMKIYDIIPKIFENEVIEPVLLHGDMNPENYLFFENRIYLIDAACFYGHGLYDICAHNCWQGAPNKDSISILYYSFFNAAGYHATGNISRLKKSKKYMIALLSQYPILYPSLVLSKESIKETKYDCIIIQGGSYNPVHLNHIRNMKLCTNSLGTYKILKIYALASEIRIKQKCKNGIKLEHRLNMLKMVTEKEDNCMVDLTFLWGNDIIKHYQNLYGEIPIYICCGSDTIKYQMNHFNNVIFLVVKRNGYDIEPDITDNHIVLIDNSDEKTISSSYIRANYMSDQIKECLDDDVFEYLRLSVAR